VRDFFSQIGSELPPHSGGLPIKGREREAPGLRGQSDLLMQVKVPARAKCGLKFHLEAGARGTELSLPQPEDNDVAQKRVGWGLA